MNLCLRKTLYSIGIGFAIIGAISVGLSLYGYNFYLRHQKDFPDNRQYSALLDSCSLQNEEVQKSVDSRLSDDEIIEWADATVPQVMQLSYKDFQEKLLSNKAKFTPKGWCGFIQALIESRIIDAVREKELIVTLVAHASAKITHHSAVGKIPTWQVALPVSLSFQSKNLNAIIPASIEGMLEIEIMQISQQGIHDSVGLSRWVLLPKDK